MSRTLTHDLESVRAIALRIRENGDMSDTVKRMIGIVLENSPVNRSPLVAMLADIPRISKRLRDGAIVGRLGFTSRVATTAEG